LTTKPYADFLPKAAAKARHAEYARLYGDRQHESGEDEEEDEDEAAAAAADKEDAAAAPATRNSLKPASATAAAADDFDAEATQPMDGGYGGGVDYDLPAYDAYDEQPPADAVGGAAASAPGLTEPESELDEEDAALMDGWRRSSQGTGDAAVAPTDSWTPRTAKLYALLQRHFATLKGKVITTHQSLLAGAADPTSSSSPMSSGGSSDARAKPAGVRKAVGLFYELLVLKTKDYVQVKQAEPFGDIVVTKGPLFGSAAPEPEADAAEVGASSAASSQKSKSKDAPAAKARGSSASSSSSAAAAASKLRRGAAPTSAAKKRKVKARGDTSDEEEQDDDGDDQ